MKKKIIKFLNNFNLYHKKQFPKKDYSNFIHGILLSMSVESNKKVKIVQVGANDGIHGDPLYEYVKKFSERINLLCIEPQLSAFNSLKKNYQNISNVYFNLRFGLLDLLIHTLLPFFNSPYIEPVLGQCAIIILLFILISTKKRLYLFINSPDISLFSKFIYIYL